ncbi:hypothetical protein OVA14_07260 [Agrococcus sp. SL85]|uniref:hypothetical protein n=1 Tax=Agrococcus sp. SL85 TaxID=2995141 RepID=UPI00226CBAF9|nr:hypothetical protein [Agrococcus sp. SL85]WAC65191.1 hypothetical protein OVA14_07260 [Agrococcus sp. SL85]
MPTITGNIADTGTTPLGTAQDARVVFRVLTPASDFAGAVHVTQDFAVPCTATGTFSADLPEYVGGTEVWVGITWRQDSSDIAPERARRIDWLPRPIYPPAAGGALADLLGADASTGVYWEGPTPPPGPMLWLYIEPSFDPDSGAPLPVYTAPDGTTIEHGELVEWSA